LDFSWDPSKREDNWRLRKVDFAEAIGIFDDPDLVEAYDDRTDYGETRLQAIGSTGGICYFVAYTWRGHTRHIITAWKLGIEGEKCYRNLLARRHRSDEDAR